MCKLNNLFVFHGTWAIVIQSVLDFLKLIQVFFTSGNKVRICLYITRCFGHRRIFMAERLAQFASIPLKIAEYLIVCWKYKSGLDFCSALVVEGINVKSDCLSNKLKFRLEHFWFLGGFSLLNWPKFEYISINTQIISC